MKQNNTSQLRNPFWTENFPDPFILKVRGRYYAYATTGEVAPAQGTAVFPVLTSLDMVHWEEVGRVVSALGDPYYFYWAPEVTEFNGQYLLYYAVHYGQFIGSIRVAVADRPEGPFIDAGRNLTEHLTPWAIDPHVFRDNDGQWYLYMTIEYWDDPSGFVGSGNAVARMKDPYTVEGPLTRVTPPGQSWQLFEAARKDRNGVDWYTVEGPTVLQHRERYYQMFSGGCYYKDNYAVSFATASHPMGPDGMRDTSWQDWPGKDGQAFLLRGNGSDFIGPGHNSLVYGPNNVDLYTAYHAWQQDWKWRRACLERVYWLGEIPWIPAPRVLPAQPQPPRWQETFQASTLAPSWQIQSGQWGLEDGELVQHDDTTTASITQQEPTGGAWVLEVNVRAVSGAGQYGVLLLDHSGTIGEIGLTANGSLSIKIAGDAEGVVQALPEGSNVQGYHQVLLMCSGRVLQVQFDRLPVSEIVLPRPVEQFALFTQQCRAAFSALALTDHFTDEFLDEDQAFDMLGWQVQSEELVSSWQIQSGGLVQGSLKQGIHELQKGVALSRFEYGATFCLTEGNKAGRPAVGLSLHTDAGERWCVWLTHQQERPALVFEREGEEVTLLMLSEGFNLADWHTVRIEWDEGVLRVMLDQQEEIVKQVSAQKLQPGIIVRDATAAYMRVWLTGWPEQGHLR